MTDYASVDGLSVVFDDGILRLELDRPAKRNALDDTMTAGLIDAIDVAGRDEQARVIVISGAGEHFCAGADIIARNAPGGQRPRVGSIQRRVPSGPHRLIPLIMSTQTPVICRVTGWAAGIGFQLALAADFTLVAADARLWEPFTERGFTPDSGATWLLPRLVGLARARELLLLGRELSGAEAADWGLVHTSVPSVDLDRATEEVVDRLSKGPTVALGLTKWLLGSTHSATLQEQLHNEALALELSSRSEDFREGLGAFKEKRPPDFTGR